MVHENCEERWRNRIADEIVATCPDTSDYGAECPDCTEVAHFVRTNRS